MTENYQVKTLHNFITENKNVDSDYWYFGGNLNVINIFKNFTLVDVEALEVEILKWNEEYIEILIDCFIYGYIDESTFIKQSYFLTYLLASLKNEDIKLQILENASDIILKGESKPLNLLDSIKSWVKIHNYNEIEYYRLQYSKINDAIKISIEESVIKKKINELRQEIFSLTKSMQAFNEIDGIQDNAIKILNNFNEVDFKRLKIDLLLWKSTEQLILAKVFSRGNVNGNLINDNYFYGYLFVILPALDSTILLSDMFYFFENQKIDCELLQKIRNKLNELIAKRLIERNVYEYWCGEIYEKQKTCG